jgi:hypothetical protein
MFSQVWIKEIFNIKYNFSPNKTLFCIPKPMASMYINEKDCMFPNIFNVLILTFTVNINLYYVTKNLYLL